MAAKKKTPARPMANPLHPGLEPALGRRGSPDPGKTKPKKGKRKK